MRSSPDLHKPELSRTGETKVSETIRPPAIRALPSPEAWLPPCPVSRARSPVLSPVLLVVSNVLAEWYLTQEPRSYRGWIMQLRNSAASFPRPSKLVMSRRDYVAVGRGSTGSPANVVAALTVRTLLMGHNLWPISRQCNRPQRAINTRHPLAMFITNTRGDTHGTCRQHIYLTYYARRIRRVGRETSVSV